jgi:hypothetical protein
MHQPKGVYGYVYFSDENPVSAIDYLSDESRVWRCIASSLPSANAACECFARYPDYTLTTGAPRNG